ncbi:MAG: HAMP domain-containing protein [Solirubrobacterales bacterium]|nr:HAMP domain-containing protein [Solirubrobacterales bacterium]
MNRVPVRIRLAAGFAAGLAVVLIAAGAFLYFEVAGNLEETMSANLASRADEARSLLEASGERGIDLGGVRSGDEETTFAQVIGPDGGVIESTLPEQAQLLSPKQLAAASIGPTSLGTLRVEGIEGKSRAVAWPAGGAIVVVGASTVDQEETLLGIRRAFLLGGPIALLLATLIGYLLGSRALQPVESMRLRAREITLDDADDRLPVPAARDELQSLAVTLNQMLDRVDVALQRERVFLSDASHELRTPLAILKSEIELVRRTGGTQADLMTALGSAAEEVDHLVLLAENLLVIARAEQGELPLKREQVSVVSVLRKVQSRFEQLSVDTGRPILVEGSASEMYSLDRLRVEQALGNLVDNAMRHGSGPVTLGVLREGHELHIYVRDTGSGFPEAFKSQAFGRFTQANPGRGESGAGLGLAIVQVIVRAHGGQVEIVDDGHEWTELRLSFEYPGVAIAESEVQRARQDSNQ